MTVTGQEITDYVERVRAALADLPPEVRDELTEDLPEHLAEVAAETDGSLVQRLGEPEAYAVELRAAAGAGQPAGRRRGLDQRIDAVTGRLRARLSGVDTRLGPILGYASASEFLRLLRPAWWVLRGYLAALLLTVLTGQPVALIPQIDGNALAGLVLLVAAVLASIWLGRHTGELGRWQRRLMHAGTLVLVVFALAALVNVDERARWEYEHGYDPTSVQNPYDQVQDVFVYDSEGRLVENARLFDQNGVPIQLGWPTCVDPVRPENEGPVRRTYPYCPEEAPFGPRPPAAVPAPPGPVPTGAAPTPTGRPSESVAPNGGAPTPGPAVPLTPSPTAAAPGGPAAPPVGPTPEPTR
ncbi:HAAS signaling domain-containing protein [Micromonospora psammae]|uniref:HAAS signaling domain-containing protein n=1 Tax=Micromonospora sp. CPCC 205556 TaxID=3122398 RepID=UPI002FF0EE06